MKKINLRLRRKGESGQSLVELAISLTVILMLLSGAVDFGMAFFTYTALRDAAQEGALFGSFNPPHDSASFQAIEVRVRKASTNPVNLNDSSKVHVQISLTNGPSADCQGYVGSSSNGVQVSVSYDYPIIMPFLGAIIGRQDIPLTATVTDTILSPACP